MKFRLLCAAGLITFISANPVLANSHPSHLKHLSQINKTTQAKMPESAQIPMESVRRFATVIAQIKRYYIKDVKDEVLFNNAIRGMLSNLDPHSSYLDINDLKDLQSTTTGQFGGIGVEVLPENGFIKVVSPLDDSPAFKAGIKAGDLIIRINSKLVKKMSLRKAINMIRGLKGTNVELTILRKNESKPLKFSVERADIKIKAVRSQMLAPGYGYIRIAIFQAPAKKQIIEALAKLRKENHGKPLDGLVLDMRNNPGGLLDSAIEVSDLFLDANNLHQNKLIVYTKGRIKGSNITANAHKGDVLHNIPIVVLINQGSASASEIVAGALQDHNRAIVMGTRSFGKGSVQTIIPIDYKSGIKLTTALYYTPKGRSIQAEGIEPDLLIANLKLPKPDAESALVDPIKESDLKGFIANGNGEKNTHPTGAKKGEVSTDPNLAHKDFQLYQALNLLKGIHSMSD